MSKIDDLNSAIEKGKYLSDGTVTGLLLDAWPAISEVLEAVENQHDECESRRKHIGVDVARFGCSNPACAAFRKFKDGTDGNASLKGEK